MSSTAFVLPILAEKNELVTAHGRAAFAILLFQDLAIIPLLALMPLLGVTDGGGESRSTAVMALETLVVFAGVILGGRYLIRPVFRVIASTHNHEIFTATALLIVVGTGVLMEHIGMSMSLGAFLAGVLLAESEYRHELQANIEPFKGLLLGLFFIAVGMSANLSLLVQQPLTVLELVVAFMAVKAAVLYAINRRSGLEQDQARHVALTLPQGGEFAFVLFSLAISFQIIDRALADLLIVAVTLSMIVTPFLVSLDARITRASAPVTSREFDAIDEPENPVIIAGFGRVGQIVGRILRMRRIPFTALEINPTQVDFVRKFGNKIFFGDASRLDLLRSASADKAKVFVLAIDDVEASVRTAEMVKRHFPQLEIFGRARNRHHAHELMSIGVKLIMRETLLSSIDLSEHVLRALGFSEQAAHETVTRFQEHDEAALLSQFAIRHDETQLIQSAQQISQELQSLFETDAETAASPDTLKPDLRTAT